MSTQLVERERGVLVELPPEEIEGQSLEALASIANREHDLVLQAGTALIAHAIRAGEALLEAKNHVPRGQWEQWLVDNVTDRSLSTPRAYMRMAKHKYQLLELQPTTMKGARRALWGGAPSNRMVDDDEIAEMKRLRGEGLSYRVIAERMGVTQSSVFRYTNPKAEQRRLRRAKEKTMAGRRALNRENRNKTMRAAGGAAAEAYALVRRALEALEAAVGEAESREAKRFVQDAMNRLYNAEDAILKAVTVKPETQP